MVFIPEVVSNLFSRKLQGPGVPNHNRTRSSFSIVVVRNSSPFHLEVSEEFHPFNGHLLSAIDFFFTSVTLDRTGTCMMHMRRLGYVESRHRGSSY